MGLPDTEAGELQWILCKLVNSEYKSSCSHDLYQWQQDRNAYIVSTCGNHIPNRFQLDPFGRNTAASRHTVEFLYRVMLSPLLWFGYVPSSVSLEWNRVYKRAVLLLELLLLVTTNNGDSIRCKRLTRPGKVILLYDRCMVDRKRTNRSHIGKLVKELFIKLTFLNFR